MLRGAIPQLPDIARNRDVLAGTKFSHPCDSQEHHFILGTLAYPMLPNEEYIEQAHLFRSMVERIGDNIPVQDLLQTVRHELLATTKLPLAIDFMLNELKHTGGFGTAMARLGHYFAPFQTFVIQQAESDRGRFDFRIALKVLWREAEYKSKGASPQGVFLFQFESLCRNRLSYDIGLDAMAKDPIYDDIWSQWIYTVRRQVGLVDLADLIFVRSDYYSVKRPQFIDKSQPEELWKPLFGEKEGRIALASRRKDPLLLFAALQRQLGYPVVPKPEPPDSTIELLPQLARRMERMEARVKFLEDEQKGGIDLTKLYKDPNNP